MAARLGVALHELSPQAASLEEAFMEQTNSEIDYRGLDVAARADTLSVEARS